MYDTTKPYKDGISSLIKKTWNTPYVLVEEGAVKKKFSYLEYHHTDGIGTKGRYHWKERSFKNAVEDAMAMNLNDLAMARAVPFAITDHLFLPQDDHDAIMEVITHLVEECRKRDIAITGGETAIHEGMEGMELSITMLGLIKEPKLNRWQAGDTLVGIASSGLQANGFTRVREIFGEERRPEFVTSTYVYADAVLSLGEKIDIHGMMHITGGAFTKLKGVLSDTDVVIRRSHTPEPQKIFFELYERGVSDEEMYKTFNCGIGFIMGVDPSDVPTAIGEFEKSGFEAGRIGEVVSGSGRVRVESKFSAAAVEY